MLFDLLDAVDGEIARWQKSSSSKGLFSRPSQSCIDRVPEPGDTRTTLLSAQRQMTCT